MNGWSRLPCKSRISLAGCFFCYTTRIVILDISYFLTFNVTDYFIVLQMKNLENLFLVINKNCNLGSNQQRWWSQKSQIAERNRAIGPGYLQRAIFPSLVCNNEKIKIKFVNKCQMSYEFTHSRPLYEIVFKKNNGGIHCQDKHDKVLFIYFTYY